MGVAVERLFRARELGETVTIFGDYDVDGVTSVALLVEFLGALGWKVCYYLPHRLEEGYGLSRDAVENCLRKSPTQVLLAVDCGSTTVDCISWLQKSGIDVIVLDHHQVSDPAPPALALVNPQLLVCRPKVQPAVRETALSPADQPESAGRRNGNGPDAAASGPLPFTGFCSVGLAFKLAHAIVKRGREMGLPEAAEFDIRPLLDLVALGTIADLVPLTGENRILVTTGLERLSQTSRPGLVALKQIAQCPCPVGSYEVGFQLGPRLNAAGRLETAEEALDLLLARDLATAIPLARRLDERNRERQKIERGIAEQALGQVRAKFNPEEDFVIVEGDAPWHVGVAGIVAARMVQQFYRPAIIVGGESDEWRGSGRSIAGFDLAAALRECDDLLVRHGGHALAAGLTIQRRNLEAFRIRLNQLARGALAREHLQPPLRLDAEVGLEEVTMDALLCLAKLKPTGNGNPAVQFFARNLSHQRPLQRMGADKQHVKLWITDGTTSHEAVWWSAGNESLPVGHFDLAFAPQINEYNGRKFVQLK
ncbi:MAG TPA: DHHA1 domain-containing protein, partial [Verrucomicrobiae bacterium]|nr:DHHA1 domain-containing protein [Verrucomicrobiae bacterium]